jgi:hypothetical protein
MISTHNTKLFINYIKQATNCGNMPWTRSTLRYHFMITEINSSDIMTLCCPTKYSTTR